nr:putative ribonuclease h protein [Quercus suber]
MDRVENRDVPQQITRENSSQNPQVINNIPIIYPSLLPKDFESQIEEIDMALNKFESHDFSAPNKTAGSSISPASNGDNLGVNVDRVESREYQNVAHVENQLSTIIPETFELRKWKKLARNIPKTEVDTQNSVATKRGREGDDEIQLKLPYKKYQTWVSSHVVQGFEDMRVSELIDPVSRKWDQNLLHGLFTPHEAEIIASIPLCLTKEEDVVVWPFTPSGCYTVKSSSKFLAEEQCRSQQSSFTHNDNGLWKMIWGLSVPRKVRNFLWRACQNALPVKYNLKRRHILTEDTCEACKMEVEDIYHSLWECNQLTQLWGSIPSFSFRHLKTFSSIQEVLMFTYEERRNIELMASVMWTIWHRRNQIRTSTKDYPLSQVIHAASQALDTFHDSVSGVPKQSRNSPQTQIRWPPPPAGRIKPMEQNLQD